MMTFFIVLVISGAVVEIVREVMRRNKKKDVGVISLINNIEKISKKRKK